MRRAAAVVFALAFVVLAVLVEHGTLTHADQYAVDHWMPWLRPRHHPLVQVMTLIVPETRPTLGGTLVCLWTWPAAVAPSALAVGAAVWLRGTWVAAALWVAANAVELAGKLLVHRPALYAHGAHVTGFDQSLPSGHTLRALVVATAVAAAWRRGRIAYAWALTVPFALVAIGDHTPTDVLAGVLAFAVLLAVARGLSTHSGRA